MPRTLVPAAAEGLPESIRTSTDIDTLLAAYIVERRYSDRLHDDLDAAENRVPAWAQPGYDSLRSDGSKGGRISWWPEVADLPEPPDHPAASKTIRLSVADVWAWANGPCAMPGLMQQRFTESGIQMVPASPQQLERRRAYRLRTFARIRVVIARIREQREAERQAGVMAAKAACVACLERRNVLKSMMLDLASGATAKDFAVLALMEWAGEEEDELALTILRRVAPALSGLLRIVVDDVVEKGEGYVGDTLIMGAGEDDPFDLVARRAVEQPQVAA